MRTVPCYGSAMAVTSSYLSFVLEQLEALGPVSSKRMFGGIGLYFDDAFFGLIDDDVVFFKVDDASRGEYEQRDMPPFRPVASKPEMVSKNYYQLPGEVLEDSELLATWARRAVQAARSKKPARSKKATRSKPR